MGKIISGIAAVFVFQVAFIWYMSSGAPESGTEKAAVAAPQTAAPETADKERPVVSPAPPPEAVFPDIAAATGVVASKGATEVRVVAKRTSASPVIRAAVREKRTPRPRSIQVWERMPMQSKVIYIPARERYNVSPSRPPVADTAKFAMTPVDRAYGTYAKTSGKISKPKKRPLLARALPAIVRKPWNLMKSLVAKLN